MQTYVCLLRWTHKGLEDIKDSPSRLDAARKSFESAGVSMKSFFMTMGQYDIVAVMEAPNDDSMAKAMLTVAKKGAIHSETMRAFTESEYRGIVSGL
jgi:uncharacterized protein with GYD domain